MGCSRICGNCFPAWERALVDLKIVDSKGMVINPWRSESKRLMAMGSLKGSKKERKYL
jgi:hypothetical protein